MDVRAFRARGISPTGWNEMKFMDVSATRWNIEEIYGRRRYAT